MKKKSLFLSLLFSYFVCFSFAQNYVSVDLSDSIYKILDYAQLNGLCNSLTGYKPYPQKIILDAVNEILDSNLELTETEKTILENYKSSYTNDEEKKNNVLHVNLLNKDEEGNTKASFKYNFSFETVASGGIYNNSKFNQWGIDNIPSFKFQGDLGSNFSYMINGAFDLTRMPLYLCGDDYIISQNQRFDGPEFIYEIDADGKIIKKANPNPRKRTVKKYINTSYLPYGYNKPWDGQMYFLSDMSAGGLEGWPFEIGLSGGITSEIRASFFDDKFVIGGGRYNREFAGMDNGRSLAVNAKARPFFGIDMVATPFDFLKFTSLSGVLEYPNQDYMNGNAMPIYDEYVPNIPKDTNNDGTVDKIVPNYYYGRGDDALYWQNAFSINMVELDFKYFHFDFGGSCIWPKKIELGYLFPLSCYVEYQNHIGDYDNLALFTDIKLKYPGLGEIWGSVYVDELNGLNNNPFTDTRDMFATQIGLKYLVPKLSFATLGVSYSKVEPYCYTHHAVKTPWYDHPLSENYTNNGESLGYYLPPNTDELLVQFNWMPLENLIVDSMFQFTRHGADYGSQQVPGSSLYSEMRVGGRDNLKKYFLHDGAYNWIYSFSVGANYDLSKYKVPVQLFGNFGLTYSYWTGIDETLALNNYQGETAGNCVGINYDTPYHKINTQEYPETFGGVLTLGAKVVF